MGGVFVPKIIKGLDGLEIQQYKGFNVVASEYISGTTFDNLEFTKARMKEVGRITGLIVKNSRQISTKKFECMSLEEEFYDVYKGIDKLIIEKGYKFNLEVFNKHLDKVLEITKKLDLSDKKHFLHKDIWPYNLIESKNGIYLLDFNDWSIGPEIIELAVPVLEFGMFLKDTFSFDVVKNIVKGYKEVLDFKFSHSDLWETMLFICYLYFLYNVIQADSIFESEIYLKRIDTLISNPDILKGYI